VPLPTEKGRLQILQIRTKAVPIASEVELERLAQITAGLSGADLAHWVNEAELLAVRRGEKTVTMADFDLAIERIRTHEQALHEIARVLQVGGHRWRDGGADCRAVGLTMTL
jgi:ATP-dependent Zn protease